ncbi:MAG: NAD(P)H-hydrate dehydratase [Acidobacteria bacterium]|jgi:NAD(P)H-hydrate epimerase|nr:NAD(P)H-hydrate dehydratase [Acidobacteriota bacterium]
MQKVLTAEQMREVDRLTTEKYGIPSILLMENAAHAAARVITEKLGGSVAGKTFLILCGKGNNGGDGAALARVLWTLGADVQTILFGKIEDTKNEARTNFEIYDSIPNKSDEIPFELPETEDFFDAVQNILIFLRITNVDCIVDGLFGTGLSKPLNEKVCSILEFFSDIKFNDLPQKPLFISLDIPSGLFADTNKVYDAHFFADLTVTFTAPKLANVFPPASNFNGELFVADIGSSQELIDNSPSQIFVAEKQDAQNWLHKTRVKTDSYKKTRGTCLIVAGSKSYTGAAVLAANACFAAGAGMVSVGVPESIREIIAAKVSNEIITKSFAETVDGAFSEDAAKDVLRASEKLNVLAVGCGLTSNEKSTRKFVREVVENRKTPIVIDADGLNVLAPFDLRGSDDLPIILTPHIGEFQRLLGTTNEIENCIETARQFAQKHNVILLLKGERSIVAAPDGTIVINPTGNPGISRAGSGDTLTGIIAGFLAQTFAVKKDEVSETNMQTAFQTVAAALFISGLAGDVAAEKFGQRLMTAGDIRDCIGEALNLIDDREKSSSARMKN